MFQLSRVTSYLSLQLVSVGYYCLEPKHIDATTLIAGKDDSGFILLFDGVDTPDQKAAPPELPAEMRFLNLPVRHVRVAPAAATQGDRIKLIVTMDADLLALMPPSKPGEFGILLQATA